MGDLRLGTRSDNGEDAVIDSAILLDHTVLIGAKATGKTWLGRVLVEGVLKLDRPVLMIDTTGDMTAWLVSDLELPLLRGFNEPSPSGDPIRLRSLDLDFIEGLFLRPPGDETDPELLYDELQDLVAALLGLAGFRAKRLSPEFTLIETLVLHAWSQGHNVHLPELVELIERPNITTIRGHRFDSVISSDRRADLAGAIAGLLRSLGVGLRDEKPRPIAIRDLLHDGDSAAATVLSFASGGDRIQKFIVAVLFAKLKTHARDWDGDGLLKMLVYMDEAPNLLPAGRKAITTAPILEALDGWSNYGIGLVLVAEELSDLHESVEDLCQTWIVGRIPSLEARRAVVHNLDLINPPVDEIALERTIKTLEVGHFVLRSCRLDTLLEFSLS